MFTSIANLDDIQYGNVEYIEVEDYKKYRTCGGRLPADYIERLKKICVATDQEIRDNDELMIEVCDGLIWDGLCHQGTLYTATPFGYYYIAKFIAEFGFRNKEITQFVEYVSGAGTNGIYMEGMDILKNRSGVMPIYKIEDISQKWGVV